MTSANLITGEMYDNRLALSKQPVTLDGKPASLTGAACEFAGVRAHGAHVEASFSWTEAARVVRDEGGRFYTPDSQKAGGSGRTDGYNGRPPA